MSSPSTPKQDQEVTGTTALVTRVRDDFADEFKAVAEGNSGNIASELRIAARRHVAWMKAQGQAA